MIFEKLLHVEEQQKNIFNTIPGHGHFRIPCILNSIKNQRSNSLTPFYQPTQMLKKYFKCILHSSCILYEFMAFSILFIEFT